MDTRDHQVTYSDASSKMWAFSTDMKTGGQGYFKSQKDPHKKGLALLAAVIVETPNFHGKVVVVVVVVSLLRRRNGAVVSL